MYVIMNVRKCYMFIYITFDSVDPMLERRHIIVIWYQSRAPFPSPEEMANIPHAKLQIHDTVRCIESTIHLFQHYPEFAVHDGRPNPSTDSKLHDLIL